jgi:ribonuclease D
MPTTTLAATHDKARLIEALRHEDRIGIDTEFMRERTYFAQLCLVQVATRGAIFFVDPLEDPALEGVWDALLDRAWVLHSGRQDIEVIYQGTRRMPASLFDTQVAAALLGFAPQTGYANLVRELFDADLAKSHTRADWTRRPLPQNMLEYAAEDVEYLLDACDILEARLKEKDRLDWALEDSAALLDPGLYEVDPGQAEARLKGARNLKGRPRRAAVLLARWREQRALDADRPRQWILKDSVLLAIAQSNPRNEATLASVEGMPAATVRRSGRDILELLAQAEDATDDYRPPARPGEKEKTMLKAMQKEVGRVADELGIAAEVVAPRKELSSMMLGERDVRSLTGWRRAVIGERLLELLDA